MLDFRRASIVVPHAYRIEVVNLHGILTTRDDFHSFAETLALFNSLSHNDFVAARFQLLTNSHHWVTVRSWGLAEG